MIERYIDRVAIPGSDTAYRLALECGCSDKEAVALAREASQAKRRTA